MKQSGSHVRFSAVETAKVKQVKFTLLSKEQIERWTICQINQTKLYQNKIPTSGGLNDLRLGVSSSDQKCQTCGETRECPGHFGRIKLAEPIYHYGYLKFIEKVLKCICLSCSRIRRPRENDLQKFKKICAQSNGRRRLINLSKLLVTVNKCESKINDDVGCNDRTPTKVQVKNHKIVVTYKGKKNEDDDQSVDQNQKKTQNQKFEVILTADKVYKILENINPTDARLMGFTDSKPVNLLITSLLVCPPQVRPSIQMNPQKKAEDNITAVYSKIINTNNQLKKQINKNDYLNRPMRLQILQKEVASIMEKADRRKNDQGLNLKIKQGSKAIKSFSQRLKGKQGRFRQHLMGKRVDFSARSVISPDSNLALDQLGVPQKIANSLTFPQEITGINIDRIKQLCHDGKILYILKPSEDRRKYEPVDLTKGTDFEKDINIGMIAERCLQDGDFVLFNRQPTLHRMSMMGHRVRILPYSTFRLNLSVCTPYNADFDGDEMNMHVPQSYESLAQIKHIAHVPRQIVTPKNNAPVMGMVQDALLGIYLFTLRDTFLTRQQIMNLVIWIESNEGKEQFDQLLPGQLPMPAILKPQPLWTGKQVMSIIIPSKITAQLVKDKQRDMVYKNIKDVNMIIKKGELITGALQKEIVGSGAGGLIHTIWLEIGPDATNYFMTTAQRIVNNWLIMNSFTVGAQDIVPTHTCNTKIDEAKKNIQNMYYDYLNKFRSQSLIKSANLHHRGKHIMQSLQFHINENLNGKLKDCQSIITQTISPYNNNIYKMIWAKSKGSETNLAQIVGMLANQNVDGHRCPEGFSRRALPHFYKDDLSPQPRGFIYSSFYKGLGPHEFFFHSMGGRQGLSDTAVKTSRTGYIQRKLIKALQDVIVKYDGTVRDSQNNIIQRLYGQDGFAAQYIQKQGIPFQQPLKKFEQRYKWDLYKLSQYKINGDQLGKIESEYEKLKQCRKRLRQLFLQSVVKDIYCPIKIQRLINNLKPNISFFRQNKISVEELSPIYVCDQVEKLLDVCIHPQFVNQYKDILEREKQFKTMTEGKMKEHIKSKIQFEKLSGLQMFRIHIRMALASKVICQYHKLDKKAFNAVIQLIKDKFRKSLIHPGQAIGAISAQCVGQPTTQMTLNTFHLAGVAATNVTLGVPRLQQLLDASRKMKTPSLSIYLKNMVKVKCTQAQDTALFKIMNIQLPQRYLADYIIGTKIYYDPYPNNQRLGLAKNTGLQFYSLQNEQEVRKKTPWVLQLSFDKEKKITSPQVWDDLKAVIQRYSRNEFEFIQTQTYNDAETNLDLHLRCYQLIDFTQQQKKFCEKNTSNFNYYHFIGYFQHKLKKARIGGIDGIKRVVKKKQTIIIKDNNGQQASKDQYWVLQTDGSNLKAILSNELVDSKRTVTNDMTEVLTVLGIEAARQSFLNEFRSVLRPYSIYINYRHLATLSDWMTRRGTLTPINRNGINRISDVSILRKASFEETVEILYDAAVFSQHDPLKGISEKIIFGEPVEIGTGNFKILIDKVKVKDYKTSLNNINKQDMILESRMTDFGGNTPNIGGTPLPINTPGPLRMGNTSIRQSNFSPSIKLMSSPSFTPNIYDMNRFTPQQQYGLGSISQRSPMILGTPILPISNRDYSPSSSPTYTNNMSPSIRPNSPINTTNYNIHGPISPYYTSSVSPSYASSHNRGNYPSSRMAQSPRYESPLSNNPHSTYTNSPSYGGTPIIQRGAKQEELSDEEDG